MKSRPGTQDAATPRVGTPRPDAQAESRPPARMRDVAQLAGVGTMTVSRVLSGSVPVSEATRTRVMAAVAALKYQPNEVARSLRKARTRSIGIIVPNFYDSFFARCAHEIALVAQEHGYSVSVTTSGEDAAAEYTEASLMMRRNVDGLIVIPAWMGESQLMKPEFASVPVVALDRPIQSGEAGLGNLSSVTVENRKAAERGVQHMVEHGHQRILFLSLSNELYTLRERHAGYVQAMKKAGLRPEACFTCATQESTLEHLRGLRAAKSLPTAVFTSNNLVTQHTLHALAALRLTVPNKVAVLGFDDLEMFDIFLPPVTVLRQPIQELGRTAAEMLFARVAPDERAMQSVDYRRDVVLPVELVVRRSCGCA